MPSASAVAGAGAGAGRRIGFSPISMAFDDVWNIVVMSSARDDGRFSVSDSPRSRLMTAVTQHKISRKPTMPPPMYAYLSASTTPSRLGAAVRTLQETRALPSSSGANDGAYDGA